MLLDATDMASWFMTRDFSALLVIPLRDDIYKLRLDGNSRSVGHANAAIGAVTIFAKGEPRSCRYEIMQQACVELNQLRKSKQTIQRNITGGKRGKYAHLLTNTIVVSRRVDLN